ncbi:ABC transporter-associated protein EcsC [Virgibacillus pantothenticus]|uniref:EcsC n=1 Tax=Virgibacillus pantothenticus TaxID=1473 RepID=A0A0L0QL65_VIRPA|nr:MULTISPECIES: EcsC family protein [Virgibacillus]API92762.1 ABC transporter-associated protein EcsC [Virgibacillus sp. 6R]KNE18998.1 ecsC [Virgibacillus pantothenticus]MBS7428264.1 EcsC family protein [Virgibacillus sp. 19R1-5]MBU8565302.1 EcsC family protein [Virgibacillus pantothenticus]MBU8599478.1 EcsC family protein [Virgibacillus pantothenticus]
MDSYEQAVQHELLRWRKKMYQKPNLFNQVSKKAQAKINSWIPAKAQRFITDSIKNMVKAILAGSQLTTKQSMIREKSLYKQDELVKEKLVTYRKTATIEGAGTGAGGILLGLADFPLLLSIKVKFLFEAAAIYGFDTKEYEERLFILHVFQLAFSNDETRRQTMNTIENWEQEKQTLVEMDWHVFQQAYRDYIDLVKLLQMVPGFGAVVGAYANYNLLDQLGETAMNAYRLRLLKIPGDETETIKKENNN